VLSLDLMNGHSYFPLPCVNIPDIKSTMTRVRDPSGKMGDFFHAEDSDLAYENERCPAFINAADADLATRGGVGD